MALRRLFQLTIYLKYKDILLVSDGFDRVHRGCFLCRNVAEEDADEHADEEGDVDAPCGYT